YDRLGGEAEIGKIVNESIDLFNADPVMATNAELAEGRKHVVDKKLVRKNFVDFVCAHAGGPQVYEGRSMKKSHEHLKIREEDWTAMKKDLDVVFEKHKLGKLEREQLMAIYEAMHSDIVPTTPTAK